MSAAKRDGRDQGMARRGQVPVVSREEFPELAAFVRGYLHEDYLVEYGSAEAARDVFLADASADERRALADECRAFLATVAGQPVSVVRRILTHDLGCAWRPARTADVVAVLAPLAPEPAGRRGRR